MGSVKNIDIELIGIGKAILNKRLAVPFYQRSYAWEDKHVLDLLTDISNAISNSETEYFIGSIVTTKNDTSRPEVVDGQQRLATATILISAIRDFFYNSGDLERSTTISSTYLQTKDLSTLEIIPRLQMNSIDNDFFVNRILKDPISPDRAIEPKKDSHRKIVRAAEIVKQRITALTKGADPTKILVAWIDFIEQNLKVIWVAVSDDSNAFTIFETLNDRGLALAISDLLKNYLFGISAERIGEVQQRWIAMTSTIEAVDREEVIVTFIRHLWSSIYGLTRERDLYSNIKKKIRNKNLAIDFATMLNDSAKTYAAILNQNHELWEKYGETARQHMITLNLLQMVQIRPLVLAVLDEFPVKEARDSLRLMVSWAVRFLITGGLGGGTLENHYSEKAKDIRNKKIRTAKQLSMALKSIVPTDAVFKSSFESATVSKSKLARYYLRSLEKQERGEKDPELVPNENEEMINLEHILPLNPSAAWTYIPDDDKETYVKRLGNMALMKTKINTEAGNDSFTFKKQFYKKSLYVLTSALASFNTWNILEINSRQKKLAQLAVKTWPLK